MPKCPPESVTPKDTMQAGRQQDLIAFYSILHRLEMKIGGARTLADRGGRTGWPGRGFANKIKELTFQQIMSHH